MSGDWSREDVIITLLIWQDLFLSISAGHDFEMDGRSLAKKKLFEICAQSLWRKRKFKIPQ
jgi:hypothetical protein